MPDRTTTGPTEVEPIELCREDRKKLYRLLDADVPAKLEKMQERLGRQDKLLAVLVPANAALLWKVFGSPAPAQIGSAFIRLFA